MAGWCVGSRSNFHKTTLWRPNGGKAIVYVDLRFHSRDVLCTLSRHFVLPGFRLFCVRLAVHFLAIYSVFRELKKAKFNDNGSKYYAGCLSVCHDSLFISLPSFIKGHKTATWNSHVLYIRENMNCTRTVFASFVGNLSTDDGDARDDA